VIARVMTVSGLSKLWERIENWLEVKKLRADLAGIDDDLATIRRMMLADTAIEADILAERRRVEEALYFAIRKQGGV
jgi:hypothetical protein